MDIEAIQSAFWRRTAMLAWIVPGLLWFCVIEPLLEAGTLYVQSLAYSVKALRFFPAEFKRVWR